MTIPPDRGHVATEQVQQITAQLDLLSIQECVDLLATDHRQAIQAVEIASDSIATFIDAVFERRGRLIYIGCGTSGRLGVLDAAECPPTFQSDPEMIVGLIAGGDTSLRTSSEAKEDDPSGAHDALTQLSLTDQDTVLGIAAGGTTPWVLGGIQFAKEQGAMTGFLTCSSSDVVVDHLICLETGPEPLTGSTRLKAGTATKLTLNIITTTLFTKLGKVYGNLMVDLKATNNKLMDRAIRIVSSICEVDRSHAFAILKDADGDVKIAVVMHQRSLSKDEAHNRLDAANGNLRASL